MSLESDTWLRTIFRFLAFGRYNTTPPSASDGDAVPLQCDASGNLKVAVVSGGGGSTTWNDQASAAYVAARAVKAAAGSLYQLFGFNNGSSDRYLQVFDSATEPAPGTKPVFSFPVPAGQSFSLDLPRPRAFSTGIYVAASTTGHEFTEDGAALFFFNAEVT